MEALGWDGLRPLPTDVYLNLVRFLYYNLEVGNLDNIKYTIDSRVRGKNIVLNLRSYLRSHELLMMGTIFLSTSQASLINT